jgi:predicted amidophosphoribosyltransferase
MKYNCGRRIALMMGRVMARSIPSPEVDFLVPVPLHRNSEREYNQAEQIAEGASRVWGIPVRNALRWQSASERQAGKKNTTLRTLPDDAIMPFGSELPGARVFLVDDVLTTGSTMMAAIRAAENGGARVRGSMVWSVSASKF